MARARRMQQPPTDTPIPTPVNGMLTPQHCADLEACLRSTADTQAIIDCLTACGMDMSHVQAELNANRNIAAGLLHFFGPAPSPSGM